MNLFERKPKTTITISIIFIFFILELLSYLFLAHRDKPYLKFSERDKIIQKFDAHTFYNYNPNTSIKFDPWKGLSDIYKSDISWEFDQFGMVKTPAPKINSDEPKNKKTIAIFGGSTVFGVGASSLDQTIATHLQKILNEKDSNTTYTVMNAGVRGYIAYQEFIRYLNDVKYLNPDIIISLNGRNDIYLASKGYLVENFNTEYSKSIESQINFINKKNEKQNFLSDIKDVFQYLNFVKLFNRAIIKFNKLISSKSNTKNFNTNQNNILLEKKDSSEHLSPNMLSALNNYILIMNLFNEAVSINDKKFFWVLQPTALIKKNLTQLEKDRIYKNGKNESYSKIINMSYEYVNLESDLVYDASKIFQNSNETLYIDDCHYNDTSNFLIAKYLSDLILNS